MNYSYSGANIEKIEKFREYGTYMKYYTSAGADSDWTNVADNALDSAYLEFPEIEIDDME